MPKGWNGNWPAKFLTVPEKTNYVRTTSSYEIHEYIDLLKWNSPNVSVINMFTSGLRKVASAVVNLTMKRYNPSWYNSSEINIDP